MVKSRAGISEDDEPTAARAKLARTLANYFPDEDERRWAAERCCRVA